MNDDSMERPKVKRELRKLDGMIPEEVDRRKFFKMSLASVAGMAGLAGCAGQGSNQEEDQTTTGDGSDEGSDPILRDVTFRPAWKLEPHHSVPALASNQGTWEKRNISSPKVEPGYGSGDTAKRVGTGEEVFGYGQVVPQLIGYGEGYDIKQIGSHITKNSLALYWRPDMVDSPEDLNGKRVTRNDALGEQTWPLMQNALGLENVNLEFVNDEVQPTVFAEGDSPAAWAYLTGYGRFQSAFEDRDADFEVVPLYDYLPTYGYVMIVNGSWLEESRNLEYTTRMLEGYSETGKWLMLNPEEAIEILQNDINPNLQAIEMNQLMDSFKSGFLSLNMTEGIKNNGYGYLDEEALENTYTELGEVLEDVTETPTLEEYADLRPRDNAELATFTNDEWSQVEELAGEYADFSS